MAFSTISNCCAATYFSEELLQTCFADLVVNPSTLWKFGLTGVRQEHELFSTARDNAARAVASGSIPRFPREPAQDAGESLEERLKWILTPPIQEIIADPSLGLPHTPYDYQVLGIAWLRKSKSALLADEMGLGKTMQALIAARLIWRERQVERILVVCPKTLIGTWRQEIGKWWPNASGNLREPTGDTRFFLKLATPNVTIKIVNYEKVEY